MIARNRRMPRGRPGMLSCSLAQTELLRHRFWAAELLTCGPQQLRYCKPAKNFGLRTPPSRLCYCDYQQHTILLPRRTLRALMDTLACNRFMKETRYPSGHKWSCEKYAEQSRDAIFISPFNDGLK